MAKNKYEGGNYGSARGPGFYTGIGAVLVLVGVFLVFQNTVVTSTMFAWSIGSWGLPSGVTVLPMLIGIGIWVFAPRSVFGKIITAAGLIFILLTIFLSVRIRFLPTGLFNYILMCGCAVIGLAMMLKGLVQSRR